MRHPLPQRHHHRVTPPESSGGAFFRPAPAPTHSISHSLNADLEKSVGTIGAQLSNKATGDAQGRALNALALGGVAAGKFAQQGDVINWLPEFKGSVTAGEFTYSRRWGRCIITGKLATIHFFVEISTISVLPKGVYAITNLPVTVAVWDSPGIVNYTRGGPGESMRRILHGTLYENTFELKCLYNNLIAVASDGTVPLATDLAGVTLIVIGGATFEIA